MTDRCQKCQDGHVRCGCSECGGSALDGVGRPFVDRFVRAARSAICAPSSHLWLRNVFRRPAVQHVGEATVQPGFAGGSVMLAVDRFIEHVRVMTPEANDLLFQPSTGAIH